MELLRRRSMRVRGSQSMPPQSVHGSRLVGCGGSPMRALSLLVGASPWSTGWRLKLCWAGVVAPVGHTLALLRIWTDFPGPGVTLPQTYA